MTLGALPHHPRQGQSSAFIDHVQHQGTTASTHPTAIHDQYQRLQSQAGQQHLSIRQKINLFLDLLIVEPSRQAFDPTLELALTAILVAMLGSWLLLLPTMPLINAARVVKC